jgi:hypothetical protein
MAILSREGIFEADDVEYAVVPCPEWGGDVRLKSIRGNQRDAYEASVLEQNGSDRKINMRNARAKLIVLCAVDEDGRALFGPDDVSALGRKNARPLDRLFDAARTLIGMGEKDVAKLTENFGATPDDEEPSA